jgi:glycerophosphoryl diester phosphodiesterase
MPEKPDPRRGDGFRPTRRTVLIGAGVAAVAVAGGATASVALSSRGPAQAQISSGRLVTPLLAADRFTIAHHGGSLDWPEESLYAYRQAVAAGVDALEVSLARSADGVWFGLHDRTLDRTSGTTSFVASEHTWAEIQTHRILPAGLRDPAQASRPYARFDDLLDEYGDTHALFVDPKYADPSTFGELFDLIEKHVARPIESVVAKGYCTSHAWATAARTRGHQTWGFYYANEIQAKPALLTSTQADWTIMGLNYDGAADQWKVVNGLGKPVIGHVIPDLQAAVTSLDLGARGLMISGVEETVKKLPPRG